MADKTSRDGYEDVLSSVRRIVATEAEAAAKADAGKLLLTPAFRADEPAPAPDAPATAGSEEPARDYPTLAQRIAELEAAVGAAEIDYEPDGSEDQAQHAPNAVVLPLNPAARRKAAGETAEADLVFAVPGEPEAEVRAEVEADAAEPSGEIANSDAAEGPPLATFRHRGQTPSAPSGPPANEDEPALLDEMALRDLVAEIVREELQGGLGERITRNVRKLVRAEIQRAFAARDLD